MNVKALSDVNAVQWMQDENGLEIEVPARQNDLANVFKVTLAFPN